jgi:hypothetical protein
MDMGDSVEGNRRRIEYDGVSTEDDHEGQETRDTHGPEAQEIQETKEGPGAGNTLSGNI